MTEGIKTWTFEGHYTESDDSGNRCDVVRAYTEEQALALAGMQMVEDNDWDADRYESGIEDGSIAGFKDVYEDDVKVGSQWTDLEGKACPNCTSHSGRPVGGELIEGHVVHECSSCGYRWLPMGFALKDEPDPTSAEIDAQITAAWKEFSAEFFHEDDCAANDGFGCTCGDEDDPDYDDQGNLKPGDNH